MTDELSTFLSLLKTLVGDDGRPEDKRVHWHRCHKCGNVWAHTREHAMKHGYDETHTCSCGEEQFMATFVPPPSHIKIGKSRGTNYKAPRRKPDGPKSDFLKQLENL